MANETISDQIAIDLLADGDFLAVDDLSDSSKTKKVSGSQIREYVNKSTTIVPVFSVSDLPAGVGGEIALGSFTYKLFNPITVSDTLHFGTSTAIVDESEGGGNAITSTASTIFSFDDAIGAAQFRDVVVNGDGTNTLFGGTPAGQVFFFINNVTFKNIACAGVFNNISVSGRDITMNDQTLTDGITFNGGGFVNISDMIIVPDLTVDNLDVVTVQGSFTQGVVGFNNIITQSKSNGNCFNIDSGFVDNLSVENTQCVGGGLWKAGGLDQTSIYVTARNVVGSQDSTINANSYIHGNSTATTISEVDTWYSIAGSITLSSDDERFTHSGTVYTYIGLNPTLMKVIVNGAFDPAVANKIWEFGVFVDDVFHSDLITTPEPVGTKGGTSGASVVRAVTGTTFEIKMRSTDIAAGTTATVSHLDIIIFDGV